MQTAQEKLRELFQDFVSSNKDRKIVFCGHKTADIDALASCAVLSSLFPNSLAAVYDKANSSALSLAEKFSIDFVKLSDVPKDYALVAVDTSNDVMLKPDREVLAVFDHHEQTSDNYRGAFNFIDPEARATAELLAYLIGDAIDGRNAALLAIAIISDTSRFVTSTKRTLSLFSSLFEKSARSYEELLGLAFPNKPLDEKLAVIEAVKRSTYEIYEGHIISTSVTSMKNGEVAHMLSVLGDIAFVAQKDDESGGVRVSARATHLVDVPLNKVMGIVGEHFGGKGGGHKKAAGCLCPSGNVEDVLNFCKEVVKKYI